MLECQGYGCRVVNTAGEFGGDSGRSSHVAVAELASSESMLQWHIR